MPTKPGNENRPLVDLDGNPSPAIYSEPWWRSTGYNSTQSVIAAGNSLIQPSQYLEPNSGPSLPDSEPKESDDVNNAKKNSQKEANHQQGKTNLQLYVSLLFKALSVGKMIH